jgi:cation transport ATPase
VQRRAAIPLGLVWLLAVLGMWALTTAALAVLISAGTDSSPIAWLVGQSALSATLACVVVGGPATAVALRVRRRHGPGPAALAGLGIAALVLLFMWSYLAASGAALRDTWRSVTPALVVTLIQLGVALVLRGRRPTEPAAETAAPAPEPAAEPEPASAEPAEPRD